MKLEEEIYSKALEKGYPLLESQKADEDCKSVYAKHKDEERFKELMKKYNIVIPDDVWK